MWYLIYICNDSALLWNVIVLEFLKFELYLDFDYHDLDIEGNYLKKISLDPFLPCCKIIFRSLMQMTVIVKFEIEVLALFCFFLYKLKKNAQNKIQKNWMIP